MYAGRRRGSSVRDLPAAVHIAVRHRMRAHILREVPQKPRESHEVLPPRQEAPHIEVC